MATTTDVSPPIHDQRPGSDALPRHHKGRKPFSSIIKRLANLKSSPAQGSKPKARSASFSGAGGHAKSLSTDQSISRASSNGPLSFSPNNHYSTSVATNSQSTPSITTASSSDTSRPHSHDGASDNRALSTKSRPAPSATTATTANSNFSSPAHSVRSLSTTLTTIQSTAPGSMLGNGPNYNPHPSHHFNPNSGPPQMFTHQFPTSNSALPSPLLIANGSQNHLHPSNYSNATAGGILTDNASIITLASSSKRQRRHSDASVRALAPSSVFGGSRESLPLSVLSAEFGGGRSVAGERGSLYGVRTTGDTGSLRETTGSIMEISAPAAGNPGLANASPALGFKESTMGGSSKRSSGFQMDEEAGDGGSTRRSLSLRSASASVLRPGDEGRELDSDRVSMRDDSSNVAVWHGVSGGRGRLSIDVDEEEERSEGKKAQDEEEEKAEKGAHESNSDGEGEGRDGEEISGTLEDSRSSRMAER